MLRRRCRYWSSGQPCIGHRSNSLCSMTSRAQPKRTRKSPEQRRAEIVETAARIALEEGLELITLRRVAEELSVRPGLISHYFPVADHLVSEAFTHATTKERESLLPPHERDLPPVDRLAHFLVGLADGDYLDLSRLWLNARHLSRFKDPLRSAVRAQESATRTALVALIDSGVRAGSSRPTTRSGRRCTSSSPSTAWGRTPTTTRSRRAAWTPVTWPSRPPRPGSAWPPAYSAPGSVPDPPARRRPRRPPLGEVRRQEGLITRRAGRRTPTGSAPHQVGRTPSPAAGSGQDLFCFRWPMAALRLLARCSTTRASTLVTSRSAMAS